jgi:putative nucleotidyltransferase with HDIG domain
MITKKDIERIFSKQLSKIKNKNLKNKVVNVWVEACKIGKLKSIDELKNMPFTLLVDSKGINIIEHTIAVTEGALALAQAQVRNYKNLPYPIDFDRLIAGGLLHDVGKLIEIEKDEKGYKISYSGKCARHPILGATLAAKEGIPQEIINIIACHSKEGEGAPQVVETIFIHHADFSSFNPLSMLANKKLII